MEGEKHVQKIVMVPWLAHGHATPFFELAKKLSKHKFQIYICSTSAVLNILKQSQEKYYLSSNNTSRIELEELDLPSMPDDELPSHHHSTKGLPQHLLPNLIKAFQMAGSSFSKVVTKVNPDLIIFDCFQTWATDIALSRNIPAVFFSVISAITCSFLLHLFMNDDITSYPFPEIFLPEYEIEKMLPKSARDYSMTTLMEGLVGSSVPQEKPPCDMILINNWKEPEAKYMQYHSVLSKKKTVSVGPLIGLIDEDDEEDDDIVIQWLDKRDRLSTVYAVFGRESVSSKEDVQEIAHGLELSNVNFLWILRYPGIDDVEQVLPDGFVNRVKDRGLVVSKWVPHARIMRHPSIGGFLNHCGWNSILECMHFGVPLIAMPFNLDQCITAKYVVHLGNALEVERDKKGGLKRDEIAKSVRNVIVDKKGEELREKSKELSVKIRLEEEKGIEEEVVEELRKLCLMKKSIK